MGLIKLGFNAVQNKENLTGIFKKEENFEDIVKELLDLLLELKSLEASFWGANLVRIKNDEDKLVEDSNHLIHLITKNELEKLSSILKQKDVKDFFNNLNQLVSDFKYFKKKINKRDKLKNLITKLSIKLVDKNHFPYLENIFILEKQLYEVLDKQDEEFMEILFKTSKLKFNFDDINKVETFIDILKKVREILSGHLEFHKLWEEERFGFSNTSNIIYSLIKNVRALEDKN